MAEAMKSCPFCAEQILAAAIKCKHCGSALDGSGPRPQSIHLAGVDPFAELHSPIAGKKRGRITVVGYAGIGLGALFVLVAVMMAIEGRVAAESIFQIILVGVGFSVASYLWARR